MRVISQDGVIDIPYDNFVFGITKDNSIVAIRDTVARPQEICQGIVAEYSSKEKAQKAMEMLRKRHTDNVFCREDIQYKAEMLLDDGLEIVREMMMKCEYFRFPKDDEVEV